MSSRLVKLAATFLLAGCVTHINPSVTSNPPPRTALHAYQRFELLPLDATPEARREDAAVRKIEQNLAQQVGSLIATWNRAGDGWTLRIEPTGSRSRGRVAARAKLPFAEQWEGRPWQ